MQMIDVKPYPGKLVRLRAALRISPAGASDRAQMWFRVGRQGGKRGSKATNLDFEDGGVGSPPPGWFVPTAGYRARLVDQRPHEGKQRVLLQSDEQAANIGPFGNPTPEVLARLAELDAEWKATDGRIADESDPDKINSLLGRIDELEFEIDETVRGKQ